MKLPSPLFLIVILILGALVPGSAFAATSKKAAECVVTVPNISCRVAKYYEKSQAAKITLSGTGSTDKTVQITLKRDSGGKTVYTSKSIKVKNGKWKVSVPKKIAEGAYEMSVTGKTGKLNISKKGSTKVAVTSQSGATFAVASVPLLSGGVARAGASVPVSYLQITNTSSSPATLKGFWLAQNGNAPVSSVIGFSTVDDKGGSRSSVGSVGNPVVFKNSQAFVPTDVAFAPKERKLFTIKAMMGNNLAASFGTKLMLDVTGLETEAKLVGQFPIRGTTWILSY